MIAMSSVCKPIETCIEGRASAASVNSAGCRQDMTAAIFMPPEASAPTGGTGRAGRRPIVRAGVMPDRDSDR